MYIITVVLTSAISAKRAIKKTQNTHQEIKNNYMKCVRVYWRLHSCDSESVFILFQIHLPCIIFGLVSQIAKYSTYNFLNHVLETYLYYTSQH